MNKIHLFILALLEFSIAGICSGNAVAADVDKYWERQEVCMRNVDELVRPAAVEMREIETAGEMREWLSAHREFGLSQLVAGMHRATGSLGALDPRSEADQLKAAAYLLNELREMKNFDASYCEENVKEYVMASFYRGLGGKNSRVAKRLRSNGIQDGWQLKWTLLTAVMANETSWQP